MITAYTVCVVQRFCTPDTLAARDACTVPSRWGCRAPQLRKRRRQAFSPTPGARRRWRMSALAGDNGDIAPAVSGSRPESSSPSPSSADSELDENEDEDEDEDAETEFFRHLKAVTDSEDVLMNARGEHPSHQFVRFDAEGGPERDRFVYVEELDCIGCTHCAATAPNTFFLESEHGRARVWNQTGDTEDLVDVAVNTCPVDCIYYVDWADLVTLEKERETQRINNFARLVGAKDVNESRRESQANVAMSSVMRCEECPRRGCEECPLYGVGENPEYMRKVKAREAKLRKEWKALQTWRSRRTQV